MLANARADRHRKRARCPDVCSPAHPRKTDRERPSLAAVITTRPVADGLNTGMELFGGRDHHSCRDSLATSACQADPRFWRSGRVGSRNVRADRRSRGVPAPYRRRSSASNWMPSLNSCWLHRSPTLPKTTEDGCRRMRLRDVPSRRQRRGARFVRLYAAQIRAERSKSRTRTRRVTCFVGGGLAPRRDSCSTSALCA